MHEVAHGQTFGKGVYFSPNPFASRKFGKGNEQVIVCLVRLYYFSNHFTSKLRLRFSLEILFLVTN